MPDLFIRSVPRSELNPLVIICPSYDTDLGEMGVNFLKKYYLWMSVIIANDKIPRIKYFALYVAQPAAKVLYFAEVLRVVSATDPEFRRIHGLPESGPEDRGKKAIELKSYTLVKLNDPISSAPGKGGGIQGVTYSTIDNFIKAKTVRDLR
jgi:hypothetical protein